LLRKNSSNYERMMTQDEDAESTASSICSKSDDDDWSKDFSIGSQELAVESLMADSELSLYEHMSEEERVEFLRKKKEENLALVSETKIDCPPELWPLLLTLSHLFISSIMSFLANRSSSCLPFNAIGAWG
jgi:hypothetical protein